MSRFANRTKSQGGAGGQPAPSRGTKERTDEEETSRPGFAAPTASMQSRGAPRSYGGDKIGLNDRQRGLLQQLQAQKQTESRSTLSKTGSGSAPQNSWNGAGARATNGIPLRKPPFAPTSASGSGSGESTASVLLAQLKKKKEAASQQPHRRGGLSFDESAPKAHVHTEMDGGAASPMPPPPPALEERARREKEMEKEKESRKPLSVTISEEASASTHQGGNTEDGDSLAVLGESEEERSKREQKERRRREKEERKTGRSEKSKESDSKLDADTENNVIRSASYHHRGRTAEDDACPSDLWLKQTRSLWTQLVIQCQRNTALPIGGYKHGGLVSDAVDEEDVVDGEAISGVLSGEFLEGYISILLLSYFIRVMHYTAPMFFCCTKQHYHNT